MMRLGRCFGLPLLLMIAGSSWTSAHGADPAAEAALKGKGLTKSGRVYVIEAEQPVLEKMKEVRSAYASYAAIVERQDEADQVAASVVALEQQRVAMQASVNALNQSVNQQAQMASRYSRRGSRSTPNASNSPLAAERDQEKMMVTQLANEQKFAKAQVLSPKDRKALDDGAKVKESAFKKTLEELRPMVDEVQKKYEDLNADPVVKKALDDLSRATKTVAKTGPSEPFAAGVRALVQAERQFLDKHPTSTKKAKAKGKK